MAVRACMRTDSLFFSHFESRAIEPRRRTSTIFNFLMDMCSNYTLLSRDHSVGLIENCGRKAYQGIDTLTELFGNTYIRFCTVTYIVGRISW